jgi:hypothetical protein
MAESKSWQVVPTNLALEQFQEFVLPHLKMGIRGPQPKRFLRHNQKCRHLNKESVVI